MERDRDTKGDCQGQTRMVSGEERGSLEMLDEEGFFLSWSEGAVVECWSGVVTVVRFKETLFSPFWCV